MGSGGQVKAVEVRARRAPRAKQSKKLARDDKRRARRLVAASLLHPRRMERDAQSRETSSAEALGGERGREERSRGCVVQCVPRPSRVGRRRHLAGADVRRRRLIELAGRRHDRMLLV